MKPARSASPPRRGVGSLWIRRSEGRSTAPTALARRAASGVVANTTRAATSAHRMGMRVVVTKTRGRGGPGGF